MSGPLSAQRTERSPETRLQSETRNSETRRMGIAFFAGVSQLKPNTKNSPHQTSLLNKNRKRSTPRRRTRRSRAEAARTTESDVKVHDLGNHGGEDGGRSEHCLTSPRRKGAEILSTDAVPDVVQSSRAKVLADLETEMPLTDDEDEEAASQTHSDEGAARSLPARAPHDRESEDDTGQVGS